MTKSIVRPLAEAEMRDYLYLKFRSFPQTGGHTEQDLDDFLESFQRQQNQGTAVTSHGLFRNGELYGGMLLYDFQINFHDTVAMMGGIGSVATDLLHKKEGVAKELLRYAIEHYDLKGAGLVALYAFRLDFYKKMGFGFGTPTQQYRIVPADLPRREKQHLQYLYPDDRSLLTACYNRFARQHHGLIFHSEGWWERLLFRKENFTVGYFHNDQLKGFLTFSYVPSTKTPFWFSLQVHYLVYENHEAFSELMGFLASQIDQADRIIFNTQDEDFYHFLQYPNNGNSPVVELHHQSSVQEVGISYRVVNVRKVFETLEERNFGNQTLKLKINILDSFYPKNSGATVVHFEDGTPRSVGTQEDFEVEISMPVEQFSSLIMGAIGFKKLYDYGFADISNKIYLLAIDKLFAAPKPVCFSLF